MTDDSSSDSGSGTSSSGFGGRRKKSTPIHDPLVGRVLFERYEVKERIGTGGMGSVYRAEQSPVGRSVAVKVLRQDLTGDEQVLERFRREAEIIGRLRHPNTIQLIDYGETEDGLAVMIMELLVGESLADRLKRDKPMPLDAAIAVAQQIASALKEAHQFGLVHRDLKPGNVFLVDVAGEIHVKVLDFGIARILDEQATRLTSTGQVFGTPRYMSPEQALSTGTVDHRSDLYSLGLILFECVTGRPPFEAQTSIQYLTAHSTTPPPKLRALAPDVSMELERLVDACLCKTPEERPDSAVAVEELLKNLARSVESGKITKILPGSPVASVPPVAGRRASSMGQGTEVLSESKAPSLKLGFGLLVLIALSALGFGAFRNLSEKGTVIEPLDAGLAAVVLPDAGPKTPVDAGFVDSGIHPDATVPDQGVKRRRRRTPKPNNKPVTGPREMSIRIPDTEINFVKRAKRCRRSEMSGVSDLKVLGCPAKCAILVDLQCAGRTPAMARSVPPGKKEVVVVCGDRVRARRKIEFREKRETVFRCR